MSALMYAICSIGGVVVVVEHICDETNRAVWPLMPFVVDDKYGAAAGPVTLDWAADEDDDTEFTTRMFVRTRLAFGCWLPLTTMPLLASSSAIDVPLISRVLFGTRP